MNPYVKAALWLMFSAIGSGATVAQSVNWDVVGPNDLAKIITAALLSLAINGAGLFNMMATKPPEKPDA